MKATVLNRTALGFRQESVLTTKARHERGGCTACLGAPDELPPCDWPVICARGGYRDSREHGMRRRGVQPTHQISGMHASVSERSLASKCSTCTVSGVFWPKAARSPPKREWHMSPCLSSLLQSWLRRLPPTGVAQWKGQMWPMGSCEWPTGSSLRMAHGQSQTASGRWLLRPLLSQAMG